MLEFLTSHDRPGVYQMLLRPKPDWSSEADARIRDLESHQDGLGAQLTSTVFGSAPEDTPLSQSDSERIEDIRSRESHRSFVVNARLLTTGSQNESYGGIDGGESESIDPERIEGDELETDEKSESSMGGLEGLFGELGSSKYGVQGRLQRGKSARKLGRAICSRDFEEASFGGLRSRFTRRGSPGIVVDASEAPSFFVLDGSALTNQGVRGVAPTPGERTQLNRPPPSELETYRGRGLPLGRALTEDGSTEEESITLPPSLQSLHVAWFGRTGSGKSTSLINGILENQEATGGADILIDPKGDGMAIEYLQAHYAKHGNLDGVTYFDCARVLPAFSFFDIRPELAMGIARTSAVEDKVEHYIEILTQIMGPERFERAVRSPDIIRYVLKAMFDPVHGQDAFTHREFHETVQKMHEDQTPPAVSDPDLEGMLAGVTANQARSFNELMGGVATRVEKIPVDRRLARIFNHTPDSRTIENALENTTPESETRIEDSESDSHGVGVESGTGGGEPLQEDAGSENLGVDGGEGVGGEDSTPVRGSESGRAGSEGLDAYFDLFEHISEDEVIIFDTGGLRSEFQRVLTLVVLSNLWSALKRRSQEDQTTKSGLDSGIEPTQEHEGESPREGSCEDGSAPRIEAEDSSDSRRANSASGGNGGNSGSESGSTTGLVNVYVEEAASVAVSGLLSEFLAQSRGFGCSVTLAMQFPQQLEDASPRAYSEVLNNVSTIVTGNVALDRRLAERLTTEDTSRVEVGNRLRALRRGQWMVRLPSEFNSVEPRPFLLQSLPQPPGIPDGPEPLTDEEDEGFVSALRVAQERTEEESGVVVREPSTIPENAHTDATEDSEDEDELGLGVGGVLSPLALTKRLPATVEYQGETHALVCRECDSRYNPTRDGMERAIECCSSLSDVDEDDIPITSLHLKLTPKEFEASGWSARQLGFVQAVYNAQQLRYDPPEYDLMEDSMLRLQEYTGITNEEIQELLKADVVRHDTDHPHRLYSVPASGRHAIGEQYRQGIDYGHGKGDLDESSEHVLAVEILRQHIIEEYQKDPDSRVTEVVPYYELDEQDEPAFPADAFMATSEDTPREASEEYDQRRLDVVGLDTKGSVVVAGEAERINHDVARAVPRDYDKMAACNPEEAIWVVMSQSAGHDVLQALNDPLEGEPRVEKTYAPTTPPHQFRIQEPGLTAVYPAEWLHKQTKAKVNRESLDQS
ncbi:hypothetical protein HALDL1_04110 [Halobacterium sp. DL1]|nr:hypothetical protein HALDL1_04110 [Halobacterium sp. DL1]